MSTLAPNPSPAVITKDLVCDRCGYSLKGLYTDGSCPECGTPVRRGSSGFRRYSENLVDAPIGYIKTLAFASGATALSAVMVTLGVALMLVYRLPGVALIAVVGPVIYAGGVFVLTMQRPRDADALPDVLLDSRWVRWITRVTQACWPPAVVLGGLLPLVPAPAWVISAGGWASVGLQTIGFIGLLPMCLFLSAMASWAGESSLADRFRTAGALTGGLGLVALVLHAIGNTPTLLAMPASLLGLVAALLSLVGLVILVVALVQFAAMCGWAVNNWAEVRERDARVEARRRERDREMAERAARASEAAMVAGPAVPLRARMSEHRLSRVSEDDAPLPVVGGDEPPVGPDGPSVGPEGSSERPSGGVSSTPVRRYPNEQHRDRADDVTPYGLEPDEDD